MSTAPLPLSQATNHLLVFSKHPVPGYAKTRLIPSQGPYGAAEISRLLTEHTLLTVRRAEQNDPSIRTIIHYSNPENVPESLTNRWLRPNEREELIPQNTQTKNLGARLLSAFERSFNDPYPASKVLVIGTDTPGVTAEIIAKAYNLLDQADVVIGPAFDGGYYLLGMKCLLPSLFQDIPWSTNSVFSETVTRAFAMQLTVERLPTLHDVDELEDLVHLPTYDTSEFESKLGVFGRP